MNKIIIFGFPHCGTTITKCIIGHSESIEEIYNEAYEVKHTPESGKFAAIKWPWTFPVFFEDRYKDYIKIFIIRNPLFVFSSLNRRFNYNLPNDHSLNEYFKTASLFLHFKMQPMENLYTIRYEDLFDNDYQNFKNILNNIGIKYTDQIFQNTNYTNYASNGELYDSRNIEHDKFRSWQINRPFVNNNNYNNVEITPEQADAFLNNKDVITLYPSLVNDISNMVKNK